MYFIFYKNKYIDKFPENSEEIDSHLTNYTSFMFHAELLYED